MGKDQDDPNKHETQNQHKKISSSISGKELEREVLASPECEGDGAGLAKDPEESQLLMCEAEWLDSPNLPMSFTSASTHHLLEESEVIWRSLRGFYTMQCLSF